MQSTNFGYHVTFTLYAIRLRECQFNHHFWPKYESIIHNNTSSREKVHPLLSIKHQNPPTYLFHNCFWLFSLLNSARYVHISLLIQTRWLLHWKKQSYGYRTCNVRITCGLLWRFYQLFGLSIWRHPFRIHWWTSDAMLILEKTDMDMLCRCADLQIFFTDCKFEVSHWAKI